MSDKILFGRAFRRNVSRGRHGWRDRSWLQRNLWLESLESRHLLAGDVVDVDTSDLDVNGVESGRGLGQEKVRVIVELSARDKADDVLANLGAKASNVRRMSELPILVLEVAEPALKGLERSPHVVSVQRDEPVPPALASTIPVINADDVQGLGFDGSGTTIVILDTGIDDNHDFYGTNGSRIIAERCFSNPMAADEVSLCPNGMTTDTDANVVGVAACLDGGNNICDHGSHVAGIAAGSQATDPVNAPGNGVAPGANIIAIQVFTRFNSDADCGGNPGDAPCVLTYASDQIAALNAVLALDTANPAWNIVSVNMSLGGGNNTTACDTDTRKTPIDNLLAAGIATVISAGNDSLNPGVGAPGCISTAFTVGSTTDSDAISGFSNRGPLLDVFAPGSSVVSSVPDDNYGSKGGTSMAAPHVAGALAVLREAYPTRTINNLMNDLVNTGVAINYMSGGSNISTPRIDLLAALQAPNAAPTITVDNATVTVNEGQTATNSGKAMDSDGAITSIAASRGSVVLSGTTWNWSQFQLDDHPTTGTPSDDSTVTITVTDDKGETASVVFDLTVNNVAPTIGSIALSSSSINEADSVTVSGTFSDPALGVGTETFSGTATWSDGVNTPLIVNGAAGTFSTSRTFLDDHPTTATPSDNFTVSITVTDDDTGTDTKNSPVLTVNNVNPLIAGLASDATFDNKAEEGEPVNLAATYSDLGILDTHTAVVDWGDGTSGPATVTPGAPGSGSISATHAYAAGGIYTITVTLTDDDTGTNVSQTTAVVTGVGLNNGVLFIIGSSIDDEVAVNQTGKGEVKVKATFVAEDFRSFALADIDKIVSYLCDGDDHLTISNQVVLPAIVHGGAGNDHLNAGGGPTVLLGNEGDDELVGQGGRNILIGGLGLDRLTGGRSDDVLIGGSTDADDDDDQLMQLAMTWDSNVGYPVRVALIDAAISLFDDNEVDKLTGSSGRDLFFDGFGDELTDVRMNETVL